MLSLSQLKIIALTGAIAMGLSAWAFAGVDETVADIPPIVDMDGNCRVARTFNINSSTS